MFLLAAVLLCRSTRRTSRHQGEFVGVAISFSGAYGLRYKRENAPDRKLTIVSRARQVEETDGISSFATGCRMYVFLKKRLSQLVSEHDSSIAMDEYAIG
jgi:hypothetical protein